MTPELITGLIVAIFASSGFWALILQIYNTSREKKKAKSNDSVEMKALRGLLYKSLMDQCSEFIAKGKISVSEYNEIMKYTYEPYKGLGGDGMAEKAMKELENIIDLSEV